MTTTAPRAAAVASRVASCARAATSTSRRPLRLSRRRAAPRPRAAGDDDPAEPLQRYADVARASPAAFGAVSAVALLANRALSGVAPVADAASAQSRADVICLAMSACLVLTGLTWIALKTKPPNVVELVGTRLETPYYAATATKALRDELAWAWDAARESTNCDVMAVFTKDGRRVMQAGIAANALRDPEALTRDVELGPICAAAARDAAPNYLANLILFPGRVEFERFFPVNTQAVCVRPIGDGAVLVIGSRTQRGLTPSDQRWFDVVAQKLDRALERGL